MAFGRDETGRENYLAMAARSSIADRDWDPDDNEGRAPPWGELAYLTLAGAKDNMDTLFSSFNVELKCSCAWRWCNIRSCSCWGSRYIRALPLGARTSLYPCFHLTYFRSPWPVFFLSSLVSVNSQTS